jgi:LemA protein
MKKLAIVGGVLVVIILVLIFSLVGGYNKLVRLSQGVDQSWAQVQNVYQRRADLIPNLVATVSGAANFEKETLTQVTEARASVGKVTIDASKAPDDAAKLAEFEKAQGTLGAALSRLLVVSERYPELKSNTNFLNLQTQIEGSENRISVERGRFNEQVQSYNTAVRSFPTVLMAGMFGYGPKPYFAATPQAQDAPKVQFDFGNKPPTTAPAAP